VTERKLPGVAEPRPNRVRAVTLVLAVVVVLLAGAFAAKPPRWGGEYECSSTEMGGSCSFVRSPWETPLALALCVGLLVAAALAVLHRGASAAAPGALLLLVASIVLLGLSTPGGGSCSISGPPFSGACDPPSGTALGTAALASGGALYAAGIGIVAWTSRGALRGLTLGRKG
jgi:hypothetical protein